MRTLVLVAWVAAAPASAATADAEKAAAAERLAGAARQALDAVLGPGRAQVQVEVQGDRSEVETESEMLIPIDKGSPAGRAATRLLDLPGYAKERSAEAAPRGKPPAPALFQRERERSTRDAGFQIRSVRATAILDSRLDDASARAAVELLSRVLGIEAARGDVVTVLRAPMRPPWRTAFSSPRDWRAAAFALGGAGVLLLAAAIGGLGLVRAGRALGRELAARLPAGAPPAHAGGGDREPLPELTPGGGGLLEAAPEAAAAPGASALLGRRFDFLLGRDPEPILRALAAESTEDLSLFFGHLSESIPHLASRLFAQLPADRQVAASGELLKLGPSDPLRLDALEERLRQSLESGAFGPRSLGRLLSRVPGEARAAMLDRIAARDESAAREVSRHVFGFEDLVRLPLPDLRRLLAVVPVETWGAALRGAPAALSDLVLAELPERPRAAVRDAAAAPQPREKVDAARSSVLDAYAALEAKGEAAGGDLV